MSRRILLADDSVTIQKVIELTFMDEDFEVSAVSNGDEAVRLLPGLQPEFVIADVHMPGANGYEVCRRSKALYPQVPVLLLVGTFEPFDEGQSRSAGADAFLKKPFDSQELLQKVQALLAESAPSAPAAAPAIPETPAMPTMPAMPAMTEPAAAWPNFELETEPEPPVSTPTTTSAATSAGTAAAGFAWSSPSFTPEIASPPDEQLFELEPAAEEIGLVDEPFSFEPDGLGASEFAEVPAPDFPLHLPEMPATPEERVGVPFGAAPLAGSLSEIEHRIEEHGGMEHEALPDLPDWAAAPLAAQLTAPLSAQSFAPAAPGAPPASAAPAAAAAMPMGSVSLPSDRLSDEDVDRIARRLVEILGDKVVRDVAWEVVPDLAEVVIKDRLRELESQVE
jgi:CheY-like chemotaxis protein